MRIGIDIRLQNESGVGRYIRNLIAGLLRFDKKNEYILFSNSKFQISNFRGKVVVINASWHSLREQVVMPPLLMKEKLDLVHFPYFNVPIFYPGRFVVTIHDLIIDHFQTGRASTLNPLLYWGKRRGYKAVMRTALWRAKKIIVPSKATKREVLEHYKVEPEKVVVIYEGEKLKTQNSKLKATTEKLKLLKPKQYFLYVGNAYPHKNLERLVRAFLKFKVQSSKFKVIIKNLKLEELKLILVGKEDYFYKRLKKTVKERHLTDQVIFFGQADDQELKWLYQNAIALILPSLMEGFGLPALEAMACGCLVLASDIPALKEVCGKAAVYFDPYDEEDITRKMAMLAHGDVALSHNKIKAGLKRAKMFSWKKMAEETVKIYESCLV